jgi:outer membrane protein OmpA-like peptidoglycan-associated protein
MINGFLKDVLNSIFILLNHPLIMKVIFIGIALLGTFAVHSQGSLTVYFDFNRHELTNAARMQLDSFLVAEKENLPGSIINLDGYCDFIGSDNYNNTLSRKRISAVKKFLLRHGIESGNIGNTYGHGEKDPLNENKTKEERQLNRRVELSIIKVGQTSLPIPKEIKSLAEKLADTTTIAGTNIVLKNMNFFGGTSNLLPESFPLVDEIFEAMKANPKLVIEIQGHICCTPSLEDSHYEIYDGKAFGLSVARARRIYAELIGKGIWPSRLSFKGFGHSQPIYPYPEKTEEERIANRRVEIKIISK